MVSVSDGEHVVSQSVPFEFYNTAPVLQAIADVSVGWNAADPVVRLRATDADAGDTLTYRAVLGGPEHVAYELDRTYRFDAHPDGFRVNRFGWREKHIRGTYEGEDAEFVLLPAGALYLWRGSFAASELLTLVEQRYYNEPHRLFNVPQPTGLPQVELSVTGDLVTAELPPGYTGRFPITVSAADGTAADFDTFEILVENRAPVLGPIPAQTMHWRTDALTIPLSISEPDGDPVFFSTVLNDAPAGTLAAVDGNSLVVNPPDGYLGSFTITVAASDGVNRVERQCAVTIRNAIPSLQRPADQTMGWREAERTVTLVGSDADSADLEHLRYQVGLEGATSAQVALILEGRELSIKPLQGYRGVFTVVASVSDGLAGATQKFKVTVANSAPVLTALPTQRMHWKETEKTVELVASDADNDALTFSAALNPGYAGRAVLSMNGNVLKVQPQGATLGSFSIGLRVSDGVDTALGQVWFSIENRAPVLQAIAPLYLGRSEGMRSIELSVTDVDGDAITYSAELADPSAPIDLALSGTSLRLRYTGSSTGRYLVHARATDTRETDTKSFWVEVGNRAPVLSPIANQVREHGVGTFELGVAADDPDEDPLTFSAAVLTGSALAFDLDQEHNFELLYGDYLENRLGNGEKYFQGRRGSYISWYVIFPDGKLYLWTGALSTSTLLGALPREYYDDPSLLFDASPSVEEPTPAQVVVHSGRLQITPLPDFLGTFVVEVSVSDGLLEDRESFTVTVEPSSDAPVCELQVHLHEGEYQGPAAAGIFTAEGRIGDSATGPGNRTFEVDVSRSTAGPFAQGETSNYVWQNGVRTPFELQYDADAGVALYTVDGRLVAHQVVNSGAMTDLLIRTRAAVPGASIDLQDLQLNGVPLGVSVGASDALGGTNVLQVLGGELQDGFTLSGAATMRWGRTNLVVNGGFEEPPTHGWDIYTSDEVPGWNVAWMAGATPCRPEDGVTEPVLEIQNNASAHPIEGEQYAELDSHCQHPNGNGRKPNTETTIRIWQDVPTVAGKQYRVRFLAQRRPGNHGDQTLTVRWNGNNIFSDLDAPSDWVEFTGTVTATTSSSRIEFMDTGEPNTFGVLLDGVEVYSVQDSMPKNSELAFQITPVEVEGHVPCGDGGGGGPGEEVCEGQQFTVLSPNYTVWNSFLQMTNILELVNPTDAPREVKISLYSILGELAHEHRITIGARNQFDVILNEFPGFVADSYGIVKLEFAGVLEGRMTYYRQAGSGSGYDFVYAVPLEEARYGTTAVSFNTFQPSHKPDERENLVANWLTIINLDQSPQSFIIWTYNQTGELLLRREIEVPAFGRADIDGGHDLAGPSVVGMHKIVPLNISVRYLAQLTRFGGDVPAGFFPSQYRFAFPLVAKHGSSESVYAPISNRLQEFNWLEVVNITDQEVRVGISLHSASGTLLESIDATLAPNSQTHIDAAALLPPGEVGYAMVKPEAPKSIIAQSMVYFRDLASGSVTSLYGSQARPLSSCAQSGSFNLFLGMENWLTVANASLEPLDVVVSLSGATVSSNTPYTIPAQGALSLPLHDGGVFGTTPNTYGLVTIRGGKPGIGFFGEVLRLGKDAEGRVDFSAPTAVR
ncbi:MAG: hypothetical protein KDD69_15330 [Bdellovibrionales bacterium]|nr:hypothetical protein [Bdellovibrionales bacterium]